MYIDSLNPHPHVYIHEGAQASCVLSLLFLFAAIPQEHAIHQAIIRLLDTAKACGFAGITAPAAWFLGRSCNPQDVQPWLT